MKICFITDNVFDLGGIQRVVSVLASELTKDHTIDILCNTSECKENRELYNLNKNVNIIMNQTIFNKKLTSKVYSKILRTINDKTEILNKEISVKLLTKAYYPKEVQDKCIQYFNSKGYDIIIGVAGSYSLLLAIISDKLDAKTIGWQHNSYDAYLKTKEKYYWHQDILFNKYIPKLDKYLVLAEYDKKMFLKENDVESSVMYNPRSFTSQVKSDMNNKRFLAAGRFNRQKGFDLLIDSFYEFSKKNNDWNLVIVGEGEDKSTMLEQIANYNLNDRITVENFTDDIKQHFLDSSVLLLSSRWEGMPMIVLESLEMGVPIISYDITAVEALIDNKNEGLIIEKFDTKKFAEAMYEISESYEMRCEMSTNAIKKSEQFDIENIVVQWTKLFENI
ncbi:glycosyltransferase [Clostridium algoriphilum]|uniref:glycosyltransferase n=1 Tax=Clostridium algoriphilum TaxID=198347 RepID=UPI001CF39597|nr:glycosyltransferase [Clostridium algoriphilum]MCB2295317.1 glycosyltransferase [Clostridium algoriphilum]